jgi:hypothetical protein
LDIRLERGNDTNPVNSERQPERESNYYNQFQRATKKGQAVGKRLVRDRGTKSVVKEEVVRAGRLEARTKYRVVILVKNTDFDL